MLDDTQKSDISLDLNESNGECSQKPKTHLIVSSGHLSPFAQNVQDIHRLKWTNEDLEAKEIEFFS